MAGSNSRNGNRAVDARGTSPRTLQEMTETWRAAGDHTTALTALRPALVSTLVISYCSGARSSAGPIAWSRAIHLLKTDGGREGFHPRLPVSVRGLWQLTFQNTELDPENETVG